MRESGDVMKRQEKEGMRAERKGRIMKGKKRMERVAQQSLDVLMNKKKKLRRKAEKCGEGKQAQTNEGGDHIPTYTSSLILFFFAARRFLSFASE